MVQGYGGTVVFFGAGASRACGYALTSEILPGIVRHLKNESFENEYLRKNCEPLREFLHKMLPGGTELNLPLITEILSIVDHCLASGDELMVLDSGTPLFEVRRLLEKSMASVIRERPHKPEVKPVEIVRWMRDACRRKEVITAISTNYDVSLDGALLRHLLPDFSRHYLETDFGFTWRDADDGELVHPSPDPRFRLYKLHGSLNWLGCHRCGHVYVNFYGSINHLADTRGDFGKCECGFTPLREVLVAPSFVRQIRDHNLLSVWRSATEALRRARQWVFIGYSLPNEDVGVRALLLRSLQSRDTPPAIRVISSSAEALGRYQALFPKCRFTPDGLRKFLDDEHKWLPTGRRTTASA